MYIEKNCNQIMIAESVVNLLRDGIFSESRNKILAAYDVVNHRSFSWSGLDNLHMEWNALINESKEILSND